MARQEEGETGLIERIRRSRARDPRLFAARVGLAALLLALLLFLGFGPHPWSEGVAERIREGKPIPVFGDGSTSRDYTHVSDIVDGVIAAIGHTARGGVYDIFNLGSHRPISLSELIAAIERATGKRATIDRRPMQPGDVERTYADVSHSKSVLGYEPKMPLERGLAEQWAWVERNG